MKGKKLILIVSVIVLSFAGVSYAAWTDNLKLEMLFSSGVVNVDFTDYELKTEKDKKDFLNDGLDCIDVEIVDNVLEITGEVNPGFKGKIQYRILNNSTMPVKYLPEEENETIEYGGMNITLRERETVIEPGDSMPKDNGWGQFQIEFDPSKKYEYPYPERYKYDFYLPFVQFNLTSGNGWNEILKIHIDITVVEEPVALELEMIDKNALETQTRNAQEIDKSLEADPSVNNGEMESDTDLTDHELTNVTPDVPEEESVSDEDENGDTADEILTESDDNNSTNDNAKSDEGSEENT